MVLACGSSRAGTKTYFAQDRNAEGRSRRFAIGKHGVLATDEARELGRQKLAEVSKGEDPSAKRREVRAGTTVSEICDWYLEEARAGRLVGRNRRPIKPSTLDSDEGRIKVHIKPLIGAQPVRGLTLADVEKLQADIATGRMTARTKRGGQTRGGAGVAGRTISTLRSLLGHAKRHGLLETNPTLGVRVIAANNKVRRLSRDERALLGRTMAAMEREGEHSTAIAIIRAILLTGFRRMTVPSRVRRGHRSSPLPQERFHTTKCLSGNILNPVSRL